MSNIDSWLFQLSAYLETVGYYNALVYILIFYIALEVFVPLFPAQQALIKRWRVNFSLYVVNTLILYGVYLLLGWLFVQSTYELPFGFFYWFPNIPFSLQVVIFFLVRDLISYGSHCLLHHWRPLWRLHLVHHTDTDIDVATTVRHHPLENLYVAFVNFLAIVLMAAPLSVLILFNLVKTTMDFYTHANIKLPRSLEQVIRYLLVTSDMHRIHHSDHHAETNSNYGGLFSFWDRLFGTYRFAEWQQQQEMTWGLKSFQKDSDQSFLGILSQPFRYKAKRQTL